MYSEIVSKRHRNITDLLVSDDLLDLKKDIIPKLERHQAITVNDAAFLMKNIDRKFVQKLVLEYSGHYRRLYSNDVGFIVPIYFNTFCQNKCKYCGMASTNTSMKRDKINFNTFLEELDIVCNLGYNTIELVAGSVKYDLNLINRMMNAIRIKGKSAAFCLDSLDVNEYNEFVLENDTMIHFQETYDKGLYEYYHPAETKKGDYKYRVDSVERAIHAGLKKAGLGVLFGLANFKEDVLMVIDHGKYLENMYGISVKLIGIPRLKPADSLIPISGLNDVTDKEIVLSSAIYRLAFPEVEMVATTRENEEMIGDLLNHSATYTNYCCSLIPGGYKNIQYGTFDHSQFRYNSPGFEKIDNIIRKNDLRPSFSMAF